ncbi:MAG: hypothetical protein HKM04_05610 [Legionellales bacterium]|nr:hypothetical protein [Legionellales bacterium]
MVSLIILVYVIGVGLWGLMSFTAYQRVEQSPLWDDDLPRRQKFIEKMRLHYIVRTIFWPYFLFFKTNPIKLFRKYFLPIGSQHQQEGYYKTLFYDFFMKNRYANVKYNQITLEVDFVAPEVQEIFKDKQLCAIIIFGKIKKKMLLKMSFMSKEDVLLHDEEINRYTLDSCRRLSESEFKKELQRLFKEQKVSAILQDLNIK